MFTKLTCRNNSQVQRDMKNLLKTKLLSGKFHNSQQENKDREQQQQMPKREREEADKCVTQKTLPSLLGSQKHKGLCHDF